MDRRERILVVEDEQGIRSFLCTILRVNGYEVVSAENGAQAMTLVTSHCPDLVILDMGLPDTDGQSIISFVRSWSDMPIIVVSARSQERDKVEALDLGADDYITKPFGPSELTARIRTALRHAHGASGDGAAPTGALHCGDLTVDYDKRRVYVSGRDANLTQVEFRIIAYLGRYAGKVVTYDRLLREIWGPGMKGGNQILRVNMANIRRKIENSPAEPKYIFTEAGVGYRMAADGE
ncbi:MAG: response regulator transcription factor [Oscillospiraceae bacterium]|nr:response regulator transcription factor [Oscillospiraceae bacterium]